jgi:gliding motility-associated-like protein
MSSYFWTNGSVEQTTTAGVGAISLTVADTNGCEFSDEINLTQNLLAANFASNPETGAQTGVAVAFTDQSAGTPTTWTWNFGDNASASTQNTAHTYSAEGDLTISLIVSDDEGCSDTLSRIFAVSNAVKVPNSFTPNSDGFNDFFVVAGLGAFPESSLAIFNRWGTQVYTNADYQNNWNGDNLPDGVYFYVLKLPAAEVLTGDITLKR